MFEQCYSCVPTLEANGLKSHLNIYFVLWINGHNKYVNRSSCVASRSRVCFVFTCWLWWHGSVGGFIGYSFCLPTCLSVSGALSLSHTHTHKITHANMHAHETCPVLYLLRMTRLHCTCCEKVAFVYIFKLNTESDRWDCSRCMCHHVINKMFHITD
jgi:hypothetical protein